MTTRRRPRSNRSQVPTLRAWMIGVGVGVTIVATLLVIVADHYWPYRYRNVKPILENVFASQITIAKYHRVYFPHPGFVAEGLVLRRKSTDPSLPPLGSAAEVRVDGAWTDFLLLRNRVAMVDIRGMHVVVPASGSKQLHEDFPAGSSADFGGPTTSIGTLRAQDSIFEVQRDGSPSLLYPIHRLVMHDLAKNKATTYDVDMGNALPTAHILAHGNFGPTVTTNLADTKLDGDFTLEDVQLKQTGAVKGVLSAQGHFERTLGAIAVTASTSSPEFAVGNGRPISLKTDLQATVNAIDGDVILNSVNATMGRTPIHASGSIAGSPKKIVVDAQVSRGRIEDLLQPFVQGKPAARGAITLRAHAEVRHGKKGESFLQRLIAQATVDAPAETLANKDKQQSLNSLSDRETHSPDSDQSVLSSLRGPLLVRDGIVTVPKLDFAAPGISVSLHGNYAFDGEKLRLVGEAHLQSDLSQATTGWKSWLLKPFDPFFKRKHQDAGAVVPIAITGSNGNYNVGQDLLHNK